MALDGTVVLKAGRKSGVVGSIQLNEKGAATAPEKEKRCPSESDSDGRLMELFSALKRSGRYVCCADKGRHRPRNPATAKSARLVMNESSNENVANASEILRRGNNKGARRQPSVIAAINDKRYYTQESPWTKTFAAIGETNAK